MCAINGFSFEDEALVRRMNAATAHRGPDGHGTFVRDGVSLGHDRLSIIDTSEAAGQPMRDASGRFTIVFNGEIYNFRELKAALDGYPFRTSSDTEVILAAYAKWGADAVRRLEGIFAFAIWDGERKELFLARDRNGVKPLCYALKGGRFVFSSEIEGVLEHADVGREIDPFAFHAFLRVLYVPEPHTAFRDVKKFPAAHCGVFANGELRLTRYWEEPIGTERRSRAEWREAVEDAVGKAVRAQLVSDRPLGMYLSGGIDSSIVLDVMSRERGNIDAYSVGFTLETPGAEEKFNADFRLAKRTAARYGARHHTLMVSSKDVAEDFEASVVHAGDLVSNPTAVVMYELARFAKGGVDVVLGGDGGDELFGGYDRYRYSLMSSWFRRLPARVRGALARHPKLAKLDTPAGAARWAKFHFQKDPAIAPVLAGEVPSSRVLEDFLEERFFRDMSEGPFESRFMQVDRMSWLRDHSLLLSDRMSMAHGVELRVPFLDTALIELAARIPLRSKVGPFRTKTVLKEAFRDRLPEELFEQPKRGWFSPGAKWLRERPVRDLARELLSRDYHAPTAHLFDWKGIERVLSDHVDKRGYHLTTLWALMTFQAWAKAYDVRA